MTRTLRVLGFAFALIAASAAHAGDDLDRKVEKKLKIAIAQEDEPGYLRVLPQLEGHPCEASFRLLLRGLAAIPSDRVHERTFEILRGYGVAAIDPFVEKLFEGKKTSQLMQAGLLAFAGTLDDEVSEGWVLRGIDSKKPTVQRNAIAVAVQRRSKNAIPKLIDLIAEIGLRRGTVAYSAHLALIELTGFDFETVEDWRNFWATHGATLDPKNLDADSDKTTGLLKKKIDPESSEFFGVEIISRRVMFIIDISGSMVLWDDGTTEEGVPGREHWQRRQRINRVKHALARAIRKLKKAAWFNIIAFNNMLHRYHKKGIVKASSGNKSKAAKWVSKLAAHQATHTDEALREAFRDPNIDTIILLSDGAPMKSQNEGPDQLIPQILEDVRKRNRLRKIRIFTFGFEGEGQLPPNLRGRMPPMDSGKMVEFLKKLASENGGTYTRIE